MHLVTAMVPGGRAKDNYIIYTIFQYMNAVDSSISEYVNFKYITNMLRNIINNDFNL